MNIKSLRFATPSADSRRRESSNVADSVTLVGVPSSAPSFTEQEKRPIVNDDDDETTWPREASAYIALVGCFFLMFNSWGLVNAYGTFASFYKEHLMPNEELYRFNLIGSTESFVVMILSFVMGRLLDAGYCRYVLLSGFIMLSLGFFTLSLTSGSGGYGEGNYALIWLTQGFTMGLGMACFFVASSQIASTWFIKRKSFAIGIVASGASIAGLIYPFMIKYLIGSLGFRQAVLATAGLTSGTALLSACTARPNPKHPLNQDTTTTWLSVRRWVDPPAFRNRTFTWFCAAMAFMFFGFYAIFFNLEEWASTEGLGYEDRSLLPNSYHNPRDDTRNDESTDTLRTFIYLSVMNASSTIGRLSSGYLSDHYGALNVHFVVTLVASLLVFFLWTFANNVAAALAFVVIFGAFSGAVIGLPPATIAHILHHAPNADHSRMGHWTGMMYSIAAPFALTGPVIAGHLITRFGNNYLTVQMWSGTCLFLSSMCLGCAIYCQRRSSEKLSRMSGEDTEVGE